MRILRSTHERWFLNEISNVIRYQLFGRHSRFFWNIIYLYPKFVADLIDIIPELFTNAPSRFYEPPFLKKELHYEGYGKVTDYVRVFRLLYQLIHESDNGKEMLSRGLDMLEHIISEFRIFSKINFSQLTIEQIDDLLWYANFMEAKHNSKEIKEVLKQYFKNCRYRNNSLLEKIFNTY